MKPKTFSAMLSNLLYEKRFGPYFIEPVIAGLDPYTREPYVCNMDLVCSSSSLISLRQIAIFISLMTMFDKKYFIPIFLTTVSLSYYIIH